MSKYTLKVEYERIGNMAYGLGFMGMLMGVVSAFAQGATKVIVTKQPKPRLTLAKGYNA